MSNQTANINANDQAAKAAREASQKAAEQAREFTTNAAIAIKGLDQPRRLYLLALAVVLAATLIFDMTAFTVDSGGPVSETQAAAERFAQSRLNAAAYSAFTSSIWGKLTWFATLGGIATVVWASITKSGSAWVPLAEVGCAAVAALMMMLLWFVGFPDLSGYSDTVTHATLLGYWLPLLGSCLATALAAKRILAA